MVSNLDEAIDQMVHSLTDSLGKISSDPYVREAVIKLAIRAFAWGLHGNLPGNQDVIADQLETMADIIRREPLDKDGEE